MPEKKQQPSDIPAKELISIEELSDIVGVTPFRIRQLQTDGIIEPELAHSKNKEKYDKETCIKKLFRYYRGKLDSRRSGDSKEMAEEKLRAMMIKRELDEIKLQHARGDIHRTADIEKVFGVMLTRLRVGLQSIPLGVAPLMAGKTDINEIAGIIGERISRTLFELINFDFETFAASGGQAYIDEIEAQDSAVESHE